MNTVKTNKGQIPIFFSADKRYIPYIHVALMSLVDHTTENNSYAIYVLTTDITDDDFKPVKALERENVKINLVNVSDKIAGVRSRLALRDYFSEAIYFRLFIPSLFKNYKKAIYVDADIILNTDIAKLYNEDLGDNYVGAILDPTVYTNRDLIYYVREALDVTEDEYFNSGVLVMNLDKFREENIEDRFYDWVNDHSFGAVAPDQDFLNVVCQHKVKYLDEGWDAMPAGKEFKDDELYLIHYNMFLKPWKYDNVLYEKYFWKYAKKSPYYHDILMAKSKITEQDRANDLSGVGNLCALAINIVESGNNYKTIVLGKKSKSYNDMKSFILALPIQEVKAPDIRVAKKIKI